MGHHNQYYLIGVEPDNDLIEHARELILERYAPNFCAENNYLSVMAVFCEGGDKEINSPDIDAAPWKDKTYEDVLKKIQSNHLTKFGMEEASDAALMSAIIVRIKAPLGKSKENQAEEGYGFWTLRNHAQILTDMIGVEESISNDPDSSVVFPFISRYSRPEQGFDCYDLRQWDGEFGLEKAIVVVDMHT